MRGGFIRNSTNTNNNDDSSDGSGQADESLACIAGARTWLKSQRRVLAFFRPQRPRRSAPYSFLPPKALIEL
jgi:hypothetical protein